MTKIVQFPSISVPLVDENGQINRTWQQFFYALFANVGALQAAANAQAAATAANAAAATANAAAATATASATSANTAATAAQTSATGANTAATAVTAQSNIANSYVTGCTVTATDAGASATITISGHTRAYGDGTSVAVTGGTVTGQAYSTLFYVYYDQASRLGGAVTYLATTSSATAAQLGSRHVVGSVTTPAAAGAPSSGTGVRPPGSGALP